MRYFLVGFSYNGGKHTMVVTTEADRFINRGKLFQSMSKQSRQPPEQHALTFIYEFQSEGDYEDFIFTEEKR